MKQDWLGRDREIPTNDELQEEQSVALQEGISFIVGKHFPVVKMDVTDIEQIEFPKDFTALTNDELTKLMGLYTQLIGYTKYEVAKADIERTARLNKYTFKKSQKYVELRALDKSHDDIKYIIESDIELNKLKKEYEIHNAKYKLLDALLYTYNQNYKVLSRELTKRGLYEPDRE